MTAPGQELVASKPKGIEEIRRRRKLVMVTHNRVLALLFGIRMNQTHVIVPQADLPEGTMVLGVHTDYARNAFAFEVCHESFDEVPEGIEAPLIDVKWDVYNLARPEPDPKPFPQPRS